jgi:hypothetical protein
VAWLVAGVIGLACGVLRGLAMRAAAATTATITAATTPPMTSLCGTA